MITTDVINREIAPVAVFDIRSRYRLTDQQTSEAATPHAAAQAELARLSGPWIARHRGSCLGGTDAMSFYLLRHVHGHIGVLNLSDPMLLRLDRDARAPLEVVAKFLVSLLKRSGGANRMRRRLTELSGDPALFQIMASGTGVEVGVPWLGPREDPLPRIVVQVAPRPPDGLHWSYELDDAVRIAIEAKIRGPAQHRRFEPPLGSQECTCDDAGWELMRTLGHRPRA